VRPTTQLLNKLGYQLQMLAAAGDDDWLTGIAWQVNHRVQWLLERERDATRKRG
jgi:hypothetical protein